MKTEPVLTDEQIQQAAQCLTSEASVEGDSLVLKNVNGCIRAIGQAVLQSPEVQKLQQDSLMLSEVISTIEELNRNGALPYPLERFLP